MQMRFDAGGQPDLPAVPAEAEYLIYALFDAGPALPGAMSPVALTWHEIDAWSRCVGRRLSPWEARVLHRMSVEYVGESNNARAHDAPPPWIPEATPERRALIARHIRNVFGG